MMGKISFAILICTAAFLLVARWFLHFNEGRNDGDKNRCFSGQGNQKDAS